MQLYDFVRVRNPRRPFEYRLATITDITYAPFTTYVVRCQLRFPTGQEQTYSGQEVALCSRDDDRAALEAAFVGAGRSLRDACRIAHDFDPKLSDDVVYLLTKLVLTAKLRLGMTFDPATLPEQAITTDEDRVQP